MKKKKLFTHNDLDGVSPVILFELSSVYTYFDFEYSCLNYDRIDSEIKKFLKKNPETDVDIYITDISVNEEVAELLNERVKQGQKVVLIDHHPTAVFLAEKYDWATVQSNYEDGSKTAATSLLYEYMVKEKMLEHEEILADFAELVRSYDTWDWSRTNNERAKNLNDILWIVGIEKFIEQTLRKLMKVTDMDNLFYRESEKFTFSSEENVLIKTEQFRIETYINKKEQQIKKVDMEFEGLGNFKVGLLFAELYQSELGNVLCQRNEELDFVVMIDAGKEKLSLRTNKEHIDVSKVTALYGGGGHPPAAGCQFNEKSINDLVLKALVIE